LTPLVRQQAGHHAYKKTEWWGAGVVICLGRGADLHMAQLMPLPLTVSCLSKIQIGFTFQVPAHPSSPGLRAIKWVCVCACKAAYNQSRPDGWLTLTASAFNQLWISMPVVLVTVPTDTQGSLHPLSTSSITARHLLDSMVQGKITEADAPTISLDATPSRLSVPPPPSFPHFYAICCFCSNPPNLSWLGTGNK